VSSVFFSTGKQSKSYQNTSIECKPSYHLATLAPDPPLLSENEENKQKRTARVERTGHNVSIIRA